MHDTPYNSAVSQGLPPLQIDTPMHNQHQQEKDAAPLQPTTQQQLSRQCTALPSSHFEHYLLIQTLLLGLATRAMTPDDLDDKACRQRHITVLPHAHSKADCKTAYRHIEPSCSPIRAKTLMRCILGNTNRNKEASSWLPIKAKHSQTSLVEKVASEVAELSLSASQ
jgi:hypothetical protein